MITVDYVRTMARYNRWQNQSIYRESDKLTDAERHAQRGAFFGSIHATLSHIQFGDQIWMFRFTGLHQPRAASIKDSVSAYPDWNELKRDRVAFDEVMIAWADELDPAWLEGNLSWHSVAIGHDMTLPKRMLVTHMFNHQTHHRGQVHCMLTNLGLKPDDTDLPFMPA
jgi:uncharacterized damage-inducible protein DinB